MKEIQSSHDFVFLALCELSAEPFTEAAYQLLSLLSHRALLQQVSLDQLLDQVTMASREYAAPECRARIKDTVHRIEVAENKPLREMTDARLRKYRKELDEMLFRKARSVDSASDAAGKALLSQLQTEPAPDSKVKPGARAKSIRAQAHRPKQSSEVERILATTAL
jgi:hypothetical protein